VVQNLFELAKTCDSIALVAAEHPLLSQAIDRVLQQGIPVCGLVAPLSASGNVGYVGLDHWKVGRTAAWTFDRLCRTPGEIGILIGNHRYRNQELNESGFRSYFREHNKDFKLLEPLLTYESAAVAREMTEQLFATHPDMVGLFVCGGGITGALAALHDGELKPGFVSVGYELIDVTRSALIDGTLTLYIAHPMLRLARETLSGSPDYSYVTLGNFINDREFSVPLPTTLQDEAINSYGVAVGFIGVFSLGAGPSAGRQIPDAVADDSLLGFAENFAIIYKKSDANDEILGWSQEFPVGYSCGRGVQSETTFDSIVPIDCSELKIRVGDTDTFRGINWT